TVPCVKTGLAELAAQFVFAFAQIVLILKCDVKSDWFVQKRYIRSFGEVVNVLISDDLIVKDVAARKLFRQDSFNRKKLPLIQSENTVGLFVDIVNSVFKIQKDYGEG